MTSFLDKWFKKLCGRGRSLIKKNHVRSGVQKYICWLKSNLPTSQSTRNLVNEKKNKSKVKKI